METEYLREFITLSRLMNFTAAAKELYISQSALSQHIQKLEKDLSVQLIGHGRGVTLTDAGKLLSQEAESLLQSIDRVQDACKQAELDALSRVRIDDYRDIIKAFDVIPSAAWDECGLLPITFEASIDPLEKNLMTEFDLVDQGYVDISVTFKRCDEAPFATPTPEAYDFIALPSEKFIVRLSPKNPLSQRKAIRTKDLANCTIVRLDCPRYSSCEEATYEQIDEVLANVSYATCSGDAKAALVAGSTDRVAIMFESITKAAWLRQDEKFVYRPLEDLQLSVSPYLMIRKDNENPIAHRLFDKIRDVVSAMK